MSLTSNRQNSIRATIQGHGSSVSQQRLKRRKNLIDRFKSLRINTIDNFRRLSLSEIDYNTLVEMRNILAAVDSKELIDTDELNHIRIEVEEELKLLEVEQYLKESADEVDSITNHLMETCLTCDKLIVGNNICDNCVQTHFS